jgi:hypothetical protein
LRGLHSELAEPVSSFGPLHGGLHIYGISNKYLKTFTRSEPRNEYRGQLAESNFSKRASIEGAC